MMAATYSVYISTRRQVLLHADANPNCKDTFGITPLIHASARGHFDTVQMLLQASLVYACMHAPPPPLAGDRRSDHESI